MKSLKIFSKLNQHIESTDSSNSQANSETNANIKKEASIKIVKDASFLNHDKVKSKEDEFYEKLKENEVSKIKFLKQFDEIVAISNISIDKTIEFIKQEGISNITFVVDPDNIIKNNNNLPNRYEAFVNNCVFEDLIEDPTIFQIIKKFLLLILVSTINFYLIYKEISNLKSSTLKDLKHREEIRRNLLITSNYFS